MEPRATTTVPLESDPEDRGEGRLVKRAARREQRAFERIYERYHGELYRYCLSILRNREDAEDALQSTMAAALRALPGESRTIALRPWLYRVAHNESISLLRGRPGREEAEDVVDSAAASAEVQLEERDRLRTLVADLRSLPERQSSAIVMRELSGLSYRDVAAVLSCSEGTARQTVYEARCALVELGEGREMDCETVRKTISQRDGRRLRGRRLQAHLKSCDGCHGFAASIAQRRSDLAAICPPLPALAATAIFGGLIGGASGAGAGLGGAAATGGTALAGGGLAGSATLKGVSVVAAAVLAAGAADVSGVVDIPLPGGGGHGRSQGAGEGSVPAAEAATAKLDSSAKGGEDGRAAGGTGGPKVASEPNERAKREAGSGSGGPAGHGPAGRSGPRAHGGSGRSSGPDEGQAESPPKGQAGTTGRPDAPGKSLDAPVRSGASGSAPGKSGAAPGTSGSGPSHPAAGSQGSGASGDPSGGSGQGKGSPGGASQSTGSDGGDRPPQSKPAEVGGSAAPKGKASGG